MKSTNSSEVLEVLDNEGIKYRDKGGDVLVKCLNPEHDDDSPSMFVHKETGKFNCFSCGFRGNIFRHFGLYMSPVKDLAYQVNQNIMLLQGQVRGVEKPRGSHPFTEDFRDIRAQAYIDHDAFTCQEEEYRGRILFPITDYAGKVVLFNGRNQHSKTPPKYKYFPAGASLPVYPTHTNTSYCILVEGMLDYLNLYDKGMSFVSTIFGTNSLTERTVEEKLAFLVLSGVSHFILLFDNDKAGVMAADKVSEAIQKKLQVRATPACHLLPEGSDPGSLNSLDVSRLSRKLNKMLAN